MKFLLLAATLFVSGCLALQDEVPYVNSVNLTNTLNLAWTVQGADIYFQLTLQPQGPRCWVGLGVHSVGSPYSGMRNADIAWATFDDATGLLLNVTDSWAKAEMSPYVDTALPGCTDDIIPGSTSGYQNLNTNVTIVQWARPLVTPDVNCDNPIAAGSLQVIWAHGSSNALGYHFQNRGVATVALVPS